MKRIFTVLVVIVMLLCCLSACNENRVKMASNSMSPTIEAGDWVNYEVVEDPSTLRQDDIIVYETENGMSTYRIVSIKQNEDGSLLFITKGDANDFVNDPVTEDQIIGRVILK